MIIGVYVIEVETGVTHIQELSVVVVGAELNIVVTEVSIVSELIYKYNI